MTAPTRPRRFMPVRWLQKSCPYNCPETAPLVGGHALPRALTSDENVAFLRVGSAIGEGSEDGGGSQRASNIDNPLSVTFPRRSVPGSPTASRIVRVRGAAGDLDAVVMGRLFAQVQRYNLRAAKSRRQRSY